MEESEWAKSTMKRNKAVEIKEKDGNLISNAMKKTSLDENGRIQS